MRLVWRAAHVVSALAFVAGLSVSAIASANGGTGDAPA
jgi:hypothetical protein